MAPLWHPLLSCACDHGKQTCVTVSLGGTASWNATASLVTASKDVNSVFHWVPAVQGLERTSFVLLVQDLISQSDLLLGSWQWWGQTIFASGSLLLDTLTVVGIAFWLLELPLCLRSFAQPVPIQQMHNFSQISNGLPNIIINVIIINVLSHDWSWISASHTRCWGLTGISWLSFL